MRGLSRLLFGLLVLFGLLAVADLFLTGALERRAATRVTQELGAPSSVDLRGWPVTARLLFSSVPTAVVSAAEVPIPGQSVRLTRLDLTVDDVRINRDELFNPDVMPFDATTGRFSAGLSGPALLELSGRPTGLAGIEVVEQGVRLVAVGGFSAVVQPSARDGDLVLRADVPVLGALEVVVPVPVLPGGTRIESVRVEGGLVLLEGFVPDVSQVLERSGELS